MMRTRFLITIFSLLICTGLTAQTDQIKKLEQQRKQALQDITHTTQLLQTTKKTASTLLNRIQLISTQISSRKNVVKLLEEEADAINVRQQEIEKEIKILETELTQMQDSYAKAIHGMLANRQNQNKILFVLSGKSLTESYRRFHYLKEFSSWITQQADNIKEKQGELKIKESDLAKAKYEKVALVRQKEREQQNLQKEEANFQKEANETKKKQNELQATLKKKQQQADALNKKIEKLIADEVKKQEAAAKAKADKENKLAKENKGKTSTGTTTTQPDKKEPTIAPVAHENLKLSKDFAANKGRLPYPITGNHLIVGRFGTHQHKQWNVSTSSNGIDIQSQSGASAQVVMDGEVSRIVAFPGYNNCIIVRHGGYYTFYGNIQTVSVKQGDTIKAGQSLGTVYTDPDTNVSLLHFQLWKGTTKLDPAPWLRR